MNTPWQEIQQTCFTPPLPALRPPEVLQIFWQHYADELAAHYPGISLRRLIQEWHSQKEWFEEEEWYFFDPQHALSKFLVALRQGIPWGYHFGRTFFYEADFLVGPATLIPRLETEQLVELAIKKWQQKVAAEKRSTGTWLDVGTGCGNILLSLLPHSPIPVQAYGCDIIPGALRLARQNSFQQAYRWHPQHGITWVLSDRLAHPLFKDLSFDLITANPPYLKQNADQAQVHPQVAQYEPATALYLADDLYATWFKEFFRQIAAHLAPQGWFFMEGQSAYLQELALVATNNGLQKVEVLPDLTGRLRFLLAQGREK